MATTTLQHANPISLHSATDDEDIALSNYLTNNNTLQQVLLHNITLYGYDFIFIFISLLHIYY